MIEVTFVTPPSITENEDGIKRAGLLTAAGYLRRFGFLAPAILDEDAVVRLCFTVSTGTLRDRERIAEALRELRRTSAP